MVSGLLAVVAVLLLGASSAGASGPASTFTVTGFGDGSVTAACTPPDANDNSVCPTLRAAVGQATKQSNAPTIELQAGTYQLTLSNGGQLDLASSMNIMGTGPGGPSGTTIQQTDGQSRVLEVDGTTQLSGLEITGGNWSPPWGSGTNATAVGGGMLVLGTLSLQDALVTGNAVTGAVGPSAGDAGDNAEGAGIAYGASAAAGSVITNSTITGNQALGGPGATGGTAPGGNAEGGGVAYEGSGALVVKASTIAQNAATGGAGGPAAGGGGQGGSGLGGGVWNAGGSAVTLIASTLANNTATGGAQGAPASPTTFGGAGWGGGIFTQGSSDTLVNSTLFQNSAVGGAGPQGGSAGDGYGGGIFAEGSNLALALESDTIDANQASSTGGNLDVNLSAPYSFTVHDGLIAAGTPGNCAITGTPTSAAYNLEDDAAGTCGFTPSNHDLVGANPELPSVLTSNGGPTQTLAPAPGSPQLGAGGSCTDPTSTPPNQPLTVDQRGQPRTSLCDIGAFQAQRPVNSTRPVITGTPNRGHTLSCSQGVWTGDGSLRYAFAWLRNGTPIPGATTSAYTVGKADPGRSLACRVTAAYYGSVAARSEFVTVPAYPLAMLLRVRVRHGAVIADLGCRGPDGERCKGRIQLTMVETLHGSKPAAVAAGGRGQKRSLKLARRSYSLLARHTVTITIKLNTNAIRLLQRFKTLPMLFTATQTTAAGTATVAARKLKVRPAPAAPRRG